MLQRSIRLSSLAALAFCAANYAAFLVFGWPLLTDRIAEWIMAHTPNNYSVLILSVCGEWAKPLATTGGLAAVGFVFFLVYFAVSALRRGQATAPAPARREFLKSSLVLPALMASGTAAVAVESFVRNRAYAAKAVEPIVLDPFRPPPDTFAPQLVRPNITPLEAFYGMSKNTVDPVIDPRNWRLQITLDGRPWQSYSYAQLLALPRTQRFTTMRCVSNTLNSNLMGTAEWSGILLRQLIDPQRVPAQIIEVAFLGIDGHDDSLPVAYAFSDDLLLALGMNGKTLNRVHGFPFRLIAPRYYGFKSVKWMAEIRLVTKPYFGTWPRMGYTREPIVHTMSFIDRVQRDGDRARVGGVSFAGTRGIRRVEIRAGDAAWQPATLEAPLSPYTWTRWKGELPVSGATRLEARALDGEGRWQAVLEKPLFPDGVSGPTVKKLL
jgi:DMSO/TMAO reductase YedYZ molybdopterin-dependent catalytic subunit